MQSLNEAELQADVDVIESEEESLSKRKSVPHRAMLAHVRRVPLETIDQNYPPNYDNNEVETRSHCGNPSTKMTCWPSAKSAAAFLLCENGLSLCWIVLCWVGLA